MEKFRGLVVPSVTGKEFRDIVGVFNGLDEVEKAKGCWCNGINCGYSINCDDCIFCSNFCRQGITHEDKRNIFEAFVKYAEDHPEEVFSDYKHTSAEDDTEHTEEIEPTVDNKSEQLRKAVKAVTEITRWLHRTKGDERVTHEAFVEKLSQALGEVQVVWMTDHWVASYVVDGVKHLGYGVNTGDAIIGAYMAWAEELHDEL